MADSNSKNKKEVIPKLPHGQGTINIMPDGKTYIYKKSIAGKRHSVYGKSVKEVMSLISQGLIPRSSAA